MQEVGLPSGWDARLGLNGRIFYYSKHSHTVQILPPPEAWKCVHGLPYGWEMAEDYENKPYYINHLTQSVSYEDPRTEADQFSSLELSPGKRNPGPRRYEIRRDQKLGFGFIAGSEKPVIIRSVTPGGPSEGMLLPDDQIVKIDSENVLMADRQRVIELIREKTEQVMLTVLQPNRSENSSFLKPAKKTIKSMDRPKVRFADDTIVNGQEQDEGSSPLLVSPGVLRILLENRQARSFQYLPDTTAGDVVAALCDKLGFKDPHLFSLVLAPSHGEEPAQKESKSRKSSARSSNTDEPQVVSSSSPDSLLVAPWDCISKVVNNPSMRHHSCHFRLEFMPKDFHQLARNDPEAFRYLFMQCVNDVISGEVYTDALTRDEILKLASIQMQELVLIATLPSSFDQDVQKEQDCPKSAELYQSRNKFRFPSLNNKINIKYVEKEYGLRRFLPPLLLSKMQQDGTTARYVRKSIQQHLKTAVNTSSLFSQKSVSVSTPAFPAVPANSSTETTLLQLRLQYLKTLSPQHLFGGRYFEAAMQTLMESDVILLVGHHYGISQMINSKTKMVSILAEFQHITGFEVAACSNESSKTTVRIEFAEMKPFVLSMDPQSAHNLAFMVVGYCRVYGNVDMVLTLPLPESTSVPLYFGPHKVMPSTWNYPPVSSYKARNTADVYAPNLAGDLSPMYFYCDFSEPVTPAVLSHDSPLDIRRTNGLHAESSPNEEIDSENGEVAQVLSVDKLSNLENSDTNNNNSFHENEQDTIYEEIKPPDEYSLPESPVSSLSTGQYSEPTPSHSPMYVSRESSQRISQHLSADGYELPLVQVRRQLQELPETEGEGDWNELMKALKVSKPDGELTGLNELEELDLPPPPESPDDIITEEQEQSDDSKVAETLVEPQQLSKIETTTNTTELLLAAPIEAKLRSRSLLSDTGSEQSGSKGSLKCHRMSSFKPNETELRVFTQSLDNAPTGSMMNFTASSPTISSCNVSVECNSTSFEEVRDETTRKKLQETEELIQYFREKREQVCGNPEIEDMGLPKMEAVESTSDPTIYKSSTFGVAEIDRPMITMDIAAGNKRLRKAEKAASKNRKSWAGGDTMTRNIGLDEHKYISMSNPDLPSSLPRKRRKGFFWRVFGRKSRTMSSMYDTNGMDKEYPSKLSIKSKNKSLKKFHFPTPKFKIKRAFTLGSHGRQTSLPSSESPKHRRFTFRPFSHKKKSSRGFVIISEPSDDVRGVDLLPSGKYTVAGTMFQVNTDPTEIEDNVFHVGSEEGTQEVSPDVADTEAEPKVAQVVEVSHQQGAERPEEATAHSFTKQIQQVKLRAVSKRDIERPSSFLTFQPPESVEPELPVGEQIKITPVEVTTEETTISKGKLMEEVIEKEELNQEKSQSHDDITMEEILVERKASDISVRRSDTLPQNFQFPTKDEIPGSKLMKQNKPGRKLVPVYNPIIPEINSKSSTFPVMNHGGARTSSSLPITKHNDTIATSTPIQSEGPSKAIVKRKSTKNRRAPPPPELQTSEILEEYKETSLAEFVKMNEMLTKNSDIDIPPEMMEKTNLEETEEGCSPSFRSHMDDDVLSEGRSSVSDHSLVTEIFSYLQKSGNDDAMKENVLVENDYVVLDADDVTDSTLPYDENYVMPGLHIDDFANQEQCGACSEEPDNNIPEHNKIMYQMFYDELMAESSLELKDSIIDVASSDLSSLQDIERKEIQSSDVAFGSDFIMSDDGKDDEDYTHIEITDLSIDHSNSSQNTKEIFNACSQESDSGTSTIHDTDKIEVKRNATNSMTNGAHSLLTEVPQDFADSSPTSQIPGTSCGRKLPTRSPSYFVYHNLITPVGYEKYRMQESNSIVSNKIIRRRSTLDRHTSFDTRQKPPLPPKPIFH